ncbi:thermonuclease family protein [Lentzea californiensis]|uniref:thermonuclease family protein n=1 Tax=Lentzea californiensis TaxID=438851 RepID=UPI00216477AC|nr:thermonuclease family protein [Lentzea californiensis]MCR3746941.1 micrococcal nuclease [Lentzea californiensis]
MANLIGAALVTAAVGGVVLVAVTDEPDPSPAPTTSVERVIDGDTVEVLTGGRLEKVRLLNIDAPETTDCLHAEATDRLKSLLPNGSQVTLEYDVERTDRYGRLLAGVVKLDGTLVNAEVARSGLAAAITIGQNARFYPQVSSALSEAVAAGRGLHSREIACTLPAQVKVVTTAAEVPAPVATAAPAEWTQAADAARTAFSQAEALANPSGLVWTVLSAADQSLLRSLVTAALPKLEQREKAFRSEAAAAEKRAAEAVAEERRKAEAAAAAAAEEQRRRDAAAVQQQQRQQQQQQQRTPSPPQQTATQQPSNPYPGYNGPRCYEPGGKVWHPCSKR